MNNAPNKRTNQPHTIAWCLAACLSAAVVLSPSSAASEASMNWNGSLEALMKSQPEHFAGVLEDPAKHRIQIIYTQIDRDADNQPSFRSFQYRVDSDEYFYPASTVKLPVAVLALEKLNTLDIDGVDRETTMFAGESGTGKTMGRYVREILLVSDNEAYNRLYEFLGQDAINKRMAASGFADTRIMHRLQIALSVEENRNTGPIRFEQNGSIVYEQEAEYSPIDYTAPDPIPLGKAEIVGGELIEHPKDFSNKNAFPLQAQHDVIKALMFPDQVTEEMRFRMSQDDYRFVYQNMSGYPGDSGIDAYSDANRYPDGYVKFLMYGGDAPEIPGNIRIFNKVGDAYGFLTDAAYVVDFENGVEFILAATIFTNANQTFNDDTYEYDEIGFPFLRHLGQAIYNLELHRDKPHAPDFDSLKKMLQRPDTSP